MTNVSHLLALALLGAAASLPACGALSRATYASSSCDDCTKPVLLAGEPIAVTIQYPAASEDSPPPRVDVTCTGVRCKSEAGSATKTDGALGPREAIVARAVPEEAGKLTMKAVIADGFGPPREWSYGPFDVMRPDRITTTCAVTRGAERRACDDVLISDSVRIEVGVQVGARSVVSSLLKVELDGHAVTAPWTCLTSSGGTGPLLACSAAGLAPGTHALVASRADLRSEARFVVR